MLLARHEYSKAEMEVNRIAFCRRFKRIREQQKRTCQMIGELSEKHEKRK